MTVWLHVSRFHGRSGALQSPPKPHCKDPCNQSLCKPCAVQCMSPNTANYTLLPFSKNNFHPRNWSDDLSWESVKSIGIVPEYKSIYSEVHNGLLGLVRGSARFDFPDTHIMRLTFFVSNSYRMTLTSARMDLSVAFFFRRWAVVVNCRPKLFQLPQHICLRNQIFDERVRPFLLQIASSKGAEWAGGDAKPANGAIKRTECRQLDRA